MAQVINLRKKHTEPKPSPVKPNRHSHELVAKQSIIKPAVKPAQESVHAQAIQKSQPIQSPPDLVNLTWNASESAGNSARRLPWLLSSSVIAAAGLWIFQRDILSLSVFILAGGVLMLNHWRPRRPMKITISPVGVIIDGRSYFYRDIKSFWIEYIPGSIKEVSLETKHWYLPYVRFPLDKQNPMQVRGILARALPEKEHDLSLMDTILKR